MRTRTRWFWALVAVLVLAGPSYASDSVEDNDSEEDESVSSNERPIDEGMKPLYDMTNLFLDIVQPKVIFDELERRGLNLTDMSSFKEVTDDVIYNWQEWVKYFLGYVICVAVGLIFIIVMILTGLCFCCCRCCGRCGGDVNPYEGRNDRCMRIGCGATLLILNTFMLAGVICAFMTNELMRQETANEPDSAISKMVINLDSLDMYKANTVRELRTGVFDKVDDKFASVLATVQGLPDSADDMVNDITQAQNIIQQATNLANSLGRISTNLQHIKNSSDQVKTLGNDLESTWNTWSTDIQTTLDSCQSDPACSDLQRQIDSMSITDYSQLDSVAVQASAVQNVVDADLAGLLEDAQKEYDKIQEQAAKETSASINNTRDQADDILRSIHKAIDDLEKKAAEVNLTKTKQYLIDLKPEVQEYGDYRWYAGIGLSCILLLTVLFYYLGLAFGACGEPPYDEASTCNRGVGANLLMAGVGFTFLFCWILMLLTMIFFLAGGLSYTEVCRNVMDVEDSNLIAKADEALAPLLKDYPITINIATILSDCKKNEPAYQVLQLEKVVNLTNVLNLDNYGIKEALNELAQVDVTLPDIEILNAQTISQLENLRDAGLENINFTTYYSLLSSAITSPLLTDLKAEVEKAKDQVPAASADLQTRADELQSIEDNQIAKIQTQVLNLRNSLQALQAELQGTSGNLAMRDYVQNLLDAYTAASENIKNNATTIVATFVSDTALAIYEDVKNFAREVSNNVQNEIGRCRPVYQALDSSIDTVCEDVLNPFNGFWFAFGWCLFFFIPCIIAAVKLVTLYRKTEEYDGIDTKSFEDPNFDAYAGVYPGDNIPLEE